MSVTLADSQARSQALDPKNSYIVQAPAGSGKTGLLTLRFLTLLALVKEPEEVVAITFTKKAAAEMKSRILEAIIMGAKAAPTDEFQKQIWDLAVKVVKRDRDLAWGLTETASRLRIFTIDSLCASISRQMPVLSRMGGEPKMVENAAPLFREAAKRTINHIEAEGELGDAVRFLLDHLDNNLARVETLLAAMLAKREQWLRHVSGQGGEEIRKVLEQSLKDIVKAEIKRVYELIPETHLEEIIQLAQNAGKNLKATGVNSGPLADWANRDRLPQGEIAAIPALTGLAELLLTAKGTWRKSFTVKVGFPAQSHGRNSLEKTALKKHKAKAVALVDELTFHDSFRQALHKSISLPPIHYTKGQWAILSALIKLLPVCAAHLKLIFAQDRVVDFSEVSQSALYALGDSDNPTDLALKLDYKISHLLVDEFQDTSRGQYDLIKRLIAGWSEEGGNTLFLVGDPMQSIYRFREAEVGLFLQARKYGIYPVKLQPLTLKVNFRSKGGIVNWVNNAMGDIFPLEEQISVGAVPFNDSTPFHGLDNNHSVEIHPMAPKDAYAEAVKVAEITAEARKNGLSVAVLVRSRTHLSQILPVFDGMGLRYQAVDVHPLAELPLIQDLLALTRALSHPADSVAWLAILRAPWCGLSLLDLYNLTKEDKNKQNTIWQKVLDDSVVQCLSVDGQKRVLRFRSVMSNTIKNRGRGDHFVGVGGWRRWIEGCWLALGGPATLNGEAQLVDAGTYFDLIESTEKEGGGFNLPLLNEKVGNLYGAADPNADPDLSVMTLHKAKGLEFDVVILPGLDRRTRGESRSLLTWLDSSLDESSNSVPLLAPIARSDQDAEDSIQGYIRAIEKQKNSYETTRLLYVAVTRAKEQLHLLAGTVEEDKNPPFNSFLATLWPVLKEPFTKNNKDLEEEIPGGGEFIATPYKVLNADWQLPELPSMVAKTVAMLPVEEAQEEPVLFDWAGDTARLLGLVVHRYLSRIADEGGEFWSKERILKQHDAISAHLNHLCIPKKLLADTIERVKLALIQTLDDKRGKWVLEKSHMQSSSEKALSGFLDGRKIRVIIDRSFVDSDGIRWIIDFKTSFHGGGDLDGFLDNEVVRYKDQLNRYGRVFSKLEDRPIRLGLYFPLLSAWREWEYKK
ncbi:MAG: UvrD-helicase domain-containing protein [Magnetococcales bacterium]|nr:UvrD-helicase domain-containing protein [Magnetococcales bacterium]